MDTIVYEGKEYIRRSNNKWAYNNEIVIDTLQRKLTKLFNQEHPDAVQSSTVNKAGSSAKQSRRKRAAKSSAGNSYAIKCNFCDGGANENRIGFAGLCSDAVREANAKRSKAIWCGNEQNPCHMYVKGFLSKDELVSCYKTDRIKNGTLGFCNEVKILSEWRVGAGSNTREGVRQGTRRTFPDAKPDNLCVLTTRDPFHSTEADRFIFGAFIIGKIEEGTDYTEGYLYAAPGLTIEFNEKEAHQLQYYKYKQWDKNKQLLWGTGLHRTITDEEALAMLDAFLKVKETQEGKDTAQRMKDYFLKYHPID